MKATTLLNMAGGRLNSSLKDTGAAVQMVTKEFMEDLGATGIEELLQHTTSSEVAGILGNISGSSEGGLGETNVGGACRAPDVLLPQVNFDTFLRTPGVMNASMMVKNRRNPDYPLAAQHHEGPNLGQFNNNRFYSDADRQAFTDAGYLLRDRPEHAPEGAQYPTLVYRNIRWGGGSYGFVWDGSNGYDSPAFRRAFFLLNSRSHGAFLQSP